MTTKEIPQHVIVESYLYAGTAKEVAALLNQFYSDCRRVTGRELIDRWEAEIEVNTPLRLRGERPFNGFPQDEKTKIVRNLIAKEETTFAHGKTRSEHAGSSS